MKTIQAVAFLLAILLLVVTPAVALVAQLGLVRDLEPLTRSTLYGQTLAAEQPRITLTAILSGRTQTQLQPWLAERMGWPREMLIRIANGLDFLVDRSSNPEIVIGRGNELYNREMLLDWCLHGNTSFVDELAKRISDTQARLESLGKAFIFLISPNKAALYPEKLPRYCRPSANSLRARDRLVPLLRERGVHLVDSEAVIREAASDWRSFDQYGQHWNSVGQFQVLQAVFAELERQLARKIGTLQFTGVLVNDRPEGAEADTGLLMNLPFELRPESPHAKVVVTDRGNPIDVMLVGTSFMDGLIGPMLSQRLVRRITSYNYFRYAFRYDLDNVQGDRIEQSPPNDIPIAIANVDAVILGAYAPALGSGHLRAFADAVAGLR